MTGNTLPGRTNMDLTADGLENADQDVAPPPYGEHHDQLQFSQAGFNADAAVTDEGRVRIHINEKNSRLSELLAPALKRQLRGETQLPSGPLPPAYIPPSLGGQPGQTPPPRLNVVIQIVGSRGDVQPFVALGQVLRDTYGHRVRLATHATFRSFVEENGLEFFNIGGDPAQLMAFMVKNPGLMPGKDTLRSGDIKRRRLEIQEIVLGCWRSCIEAGDGMGTAPPTHKRDEPVDERFVLPGNPGARPFVADAIIANPPSFAHVHIAEKLGIPLHMMFTMPWTPTRAFPHPLADVVATNVDAALTNYISYALVEMMTWQGLGDVINRFRSQVLELEPLSMLWGPGLLNRLRIPATYCWSPALTPKPADWTQEITVSGFYFLSLESHYTPEPELAAFLAAGPPPVYIGFGSIVVDDPDGLTQTIFGAIRHSGVRAIVSKGWGGIGGDAAGVPEGVFMLGNCPHDWLFKQVSAVVHHGGAGTTAAGIVAGRPTVVVPFFGDQIFWGSMVAKAGAGPAPIPYKKMTTENLADAIQFALLPQTQTRARELGEKIKQEKGADVGGKSFHQFLNTDNMRCSLAPSRVAVWRVRRSEVRLSALAATVLVKQDQLKYSDLKLYRSIEYNTDEQPWDPISAVTVALAGDIGALSMAVADFPREIFKIGQGKKGKGKDAEVDTGKTDDAASITASGTSLGEGSSSPQRADSSSEITSITSPTPKTAQGSAETSSTQPTLQPPDPAALPPTLPPRSPSKQGSSATASSSTPNPVNLGTAVEAGQSVGRIVGTGMKFYHHTCLGLARGFRNAPKLYGDDTVRPTEKVTDFASGMRVAGKELGLGFYDGVSGLVTQPWKGAEKEGGIGLVKGLGKGIAGVFFKSSSAIFAVPAYTIQGMRAEVRNMFARSSGNYIITSRVLQGEEDLAGSTAGERQDVLARWNAKREDLKGFYSWKQNEKGKAVANAAQAAGDGGGSAAGSGRLAVPWNKRRTGSSSTMTTPTSTAGTYPPTAASSVSSDPSSEDLERAIQESVAQTSRGDKEEDAKIEAAVRASMMEMRWAKEQQQQQQPPPQYDHGTSWAADKKTAPAEKMTDEEWTNITEEEYQALIEEAVRQSLLPQEPDPYHQQQQQQQPWTAEKSNPKAAEAGAGPTTTAEHPPTAETPGNHFPTASTTSHPETGAAAEDEDDQLRRAIQESEREHRTRAEQMARQRTEEDIVLEYVKKQSLAEEEFRKRSGPAAGSAGEGKEEGVSSAGHFGGADGVREDEDEDEEFRRAIEESLRVGGRSGGSSSHAG